MSRISPIAEQCIVIVVDIQPQFMSGIFQADETRIRAKFVCECASKLGIPVWASEQVPDRMGHTEPDIARFVKETFSKSEFSVLNNPKFRNELLSQPRRQVILVGIETHICISQSVHDLLDEKYEVIVCTDAVSARTESRHLAGLTRIREAGAALAHSESVVYEWMKTAEHPDFREILKLVKAAP